MRHSSLMTYLNIGCCRHTGALNVAALVFCKRVRDAIGVGFALTAGAGAPAAAGSSTAVPSAAGGLPSARLQSVYTLSCGPSPARLWSV